MLPDPFSSQQGIGSSGVALSYTTVGVGDRKSIRSATSGPLGQLGYRDDLTISHSQDPKTNRRRSVFRVDISYPIGSEGAKGTASGYVVLDHVPGDGGVVQMYDGEAMSDVSPSQAIMTRLGTLFRGSNAVPAIVPHVDYTNTVAIAFIAGTP